DPVRYQLAAIYVLLHLAAEIGAPLDLGSEQVTGRNLWNAQVLNEEARLCAFSAARWPEQGQVQRMNPRYWRMTSWVSSCFIVSSATPTTMSRAVPPRYIWF